MSYNAIVGFMIGGTVLVGLLALLSPEIAILVGGFLALGGFIAFDQKRRDFWEQAMSFRMRTLDETQKKLSREVIRNTGQISSLKQQVSEIDSKTEREDVAAPIATAVKYKNLMSEKKQARTQSTAKSRTPITNPSGDVFDDLANLPRALKPQMQNAPTGNPAFEDHSYLSDEVIRELVEVAVRNEEIDTFLQPVMRLPQRKIRAYEMFARIRAKPGLYIPAERYMKFAKKDKAINTIDTLLLSECLKLVRATAHIERAVPFFINITQTTLKDVKYMHRVLGFISKHRDLAPRLVFEIPQAQFEDMPPALLEILRGMGKLGCSFSLGHIKNHDLNVADLQRFKVRFIRIDAKTFLEKSRNEKEFTDLWRMKRKLEGNGIGVIAERVENEDMMRELLDYDINYGQGYLFGRPDVQAAYRQRQAS